MTTPSLNKVFLAGRLTRDPDVRHTPSGTAVAEMRLAVNRQFTVNDERREETCFVNVQAWGRVAELCGQYLRKGAPILVEGFLQSEERQSDSGEKRYGIHVKADRVQFLDRPRRTEDGGEGASARPPRAESAPPRVAPAAPLADDPAPPAGGDTEDVPF